MKNPRRWRQVAAQMFLTALILSVTAMTGRAQTFRGTILGTVTDATGATVAGAKVTVKNTDTGLIRTTESQVDGSYRVPELPIGTYDVTIDKENFQTSVTSGVKVDVSGEKRVDSALKPGAVQELITVSAEALPEIETTSDTLGGTLNQETVKDLPINGRDYTKLIYLNPGVAGSPDQITDSPGSFGVFSVNGARGRANNFLLDGTDMNDGYHNIPALNQGGVFAVPSAILPVDAIAEMRVLSNFEAEYGRNAGGIIMFVTRSGTNNFHGDALEYFRNDALDARNFFNPTNQPKAPFHNNQFGGSLGGPIIHDKTFFYADYEGQREKGGSVSLDCVPDPAQISSDGGATNTVTAAMLKYWPKPNVAGTFGPGLSSDTGCANGLNASVVTPFDNRVDSVIGKIDHSMNQSNLLSGRYYYSNSLQDFPLALSPTGGQLPGFDTHTPTVVHLVSLSLVSTLSPTKVNEARFGWNRFKEAFVPQDENFHPSSIGLCAASTTAGCAGSGVTDSGLPVISVTGFSQIGATATDSRHRVDTNWQAFDNFSWQRGRHGIKMGYEFRRTTIDTRVESHFRGVLSFLSLSDFLTGTLDGGGQSSGNSTRNTVQNSHGLYVQDSFRATSRLTINAGLRWDYAGVIGEKNNLASECVVTTGPTCTLTQLGTGGLSGLYNPDYRDFAPRLNVAYDLSGKGKTVIRAGWGIFFDSAYHSLFITNSVNNSGFAYGPLFNPFGPAPIFSTGLACTGAGCLVAGSPVFAVPGSTPTGDITTVDRQHMHTPYMENFNLNLERQLFSKVALQVGYVGSQGHRLYRFRDINQPSQSAIDAYDVACVGAGNPIVSCAAGTSVPRVFTVSPASTGTFYINQDEATANSNYHSLQASLRVTGWHGLTTSANFVWSHSIDNASDGADFEPNASQPNDSTRPSLERANSNFDIRRRFTWNYVYQFPSRGGSWSKLSDGWGLDGALNIQDGQPFQLNYNFNGGYDGSGEGFERPDVVGPIVTNSSNPVQFLDLSSFAVPCTLSGGTAPSNCTAGSRHFGNMGRDSLRGPSFKQFDFSAFKDTKLKEQLTMQLRIEVFNLFNHPNFANPFLPAGIAPANPSGVSATGTSIGFLPITTTADVGPGNPFLGGGAPRGIQLAAKFSF